VINAWAFLNYWGAGAWAAPKSTPVLTAASEYRIATEMFIIRNSNIGRRNKAETN